MTLGNFRNYEAGEFQFGDHSVIVGPNAAGKTNVLEALYVLASGKSFRADRESEMVHWGETAARIHAAFTRDNARREATAMISASVRTTQKTFLVDAKKHRSRDLARLFPMVLFSADDMRLIDGSPGRRRRVLDLAITQGSVEYREALSTYTKALAGRNRLLEQIKEGEATTAELSAWDEPLVAAGQVVISSRRKYFADTATALRTSYEALTKKSTDVATRLTAEYRPLTEDFAAEITSRYDQDLAMGTTSAGPHRDDWTLLLGNRPIVSFGSGGEFRSAILAWRSAETSWLAAAANVQPITLLDDVFSELDRFRRDALAANLPKGQTIITTPTAEPLPKTLRTGARIIELTPQRTHGV